MTATSELPTLEAVPSQETRTSAGQFWGPALCLLAAMLYTGTNMALRRLAEPGQAADYPFVLFVKETITVLLVGPWLLAQVLRGKIPLPRPSHFWQVVGAGVLTQTIANLGLLWAFGTVGIAIAIPLSLAMSLITAAWMGRFWLGEGVSPRLFVAMVLLIVGIILLHGGADTLEGVASSSSSVALAAVLLSCLAGFIYGLLTVVIRNVTTGGTSGWFVLVLVTGAATVTLGPYTFYAHGPEIVYSCSPEQWLWIIVSGILNLVAFWSLTKGLRWTPVAQANLLTSSQAVMATIAGWMVFGEVFNLQVAVGIVLALAAIVLSTLR
ncbi:MAG: DMT family transporter [Thermogutta sp.]|uniref:DMT family transporter n=1 Tax=Thermogutta sp. TaxID=1962930 RepID=UPI0019905AD5|nr:DMT family transporter [Thermogutta sp.]MBC7351438.1 DMT family transporter [Thermogutta sp.]